MSGWIMLHRDIRNNWLWKDKPFDKRSAWIDILLSANHSDNKFLLGNELVEVKRGSFITSELKLMDRWGWSKTKVRSFLKVLENDNMIVKISDNKKTTINIVNYSMYQSIETIEEPQKDRTKTAEEPQKDTNNNDNNDNKDNKKNIYAEYVSMTESEYQKLIDKHGDALTNKMIIVLDNYKGSKGKKYKSDYRAILSWVEEKVLKEGDNGKPRTNDNQNTEDYWGIEKFITRG